VHHQPISDPGELVVLSQDQLFQRVKDLLRQGGLLSDYDFLKRIKPNLDSACFELGEEWRKKPRLGEREVPFSEYLAARLCSKLRALDRQHHPHLYDPHGKYRPDGHTLPLDYELFIASTYISTPAVTASYPILAESIPWPQQLEITARNASIAQPSITAMLERIGDVEQGKAKTPYRLARLDGLSTTQARYQPATGPFLAILDYLDGRTPIATATST
jgi:hypothetical protein